jgi:hypothetical protein
MFAVTGNADSADIADIAVIAVIADSSFEPTPLVVLISKLNSDVRG